jgi:hypothetical protein
VSVETNIGAGAIGAPTPQLEIVMVLAIMGVAFLPPIQLSFGFSLDP